MNIDRIQSQLIRLYGGRTGNTRGADQIGDAGSASNDASVHGAGDGFVLSDEASSVRRMVGVVAAAPDVRTELVDELRSQVQAGTYQPNDEAVARALLGGGQ
jgi:flagellar biosynthesis anti-sigma factor FlgM